MKIRSECISLLYIVYVAKIYFAPPSPLLNGWKLFFWDDSHYILKMYFLLKGPIRFGHSAGKTKLLKLDLKLNEAAGHRLKNHRVFSGVNERLRIFSLCQMPSFKSKFNKSHFVVFRKWQHLIRPLLCPLFLYYLLFINIRLIV